MRLPGAVSRLAAPFVGSQAEPFSRRRWRGRAVNGSVCLAFGEYLLIVRRCCLCMVSCELFGLVHPSLCIVAGAELHLFDSIFYDAGLL
jgi:hypothetical protein